MTIILYHIDGTTEDIEGDDAIYRIMTRYPYTSGRRCRCENDGWCCSRAADHMGPHVGYIYPAKPRVMWYSGNKDIANELPMYASIWKLLVKARLYGYTVGDCLGVLKALVAAIADGELT